MSLVFASITPHPPILIPSIGKDNLTQIKKTQGAFRELEQILYSTKPETIIVISPHGLVRTNSFTMNLSPEYEVNFEQFGDFSSKLQLSGDVGTAYSIRERMETRAPLQLISEINLDHGSGVPLFLLTQNIKAKIIPLYYSGLSLEEHFNFGKLLKREIMVSQKRIAVIASGDLSHRLTKDAPAGYSPKGAKFDQRLVKLLEDKQNQEIINLNPEFIEEAGECGLRSIAILLGILEGIKYTPQTLSYEGPFGVGYLTMNFKL